MFLQGRVPVCLKLRQRLLLVEGLHCAVTARRLGNHVSGVLLMAVQISFDRGHMHRKNVVPLRQAKSRRGPARQFKFATPSCTHVLRLYS